MTEKTTSEATAAQSLVVEAYLECALWAGLDWAEEDTNPEPLDASYSVADVSDEARAETAREVADFCEANAEDLAEIAPEMIGHDFYLTRNGHGAGFWDRGLGEIGDRLTSAAHAYGTSELYAGDDGKLYCHGWPATH